MRLSRLVVTALFTGAFLIQSQPALAQGNLALSANQGAPEKNIRANGCSWQPAPTGGAVHIFWPQNETALPQPADQVASAGPGSGGSPACFQTADFEVPQRPPGTYKVVACQDPECNFPSPNFSAPFEFTIPKPPPPPPPEPPPPPPPPPSGSPTSSPTPTLTPSATPTSTVSPTATVTATPSPGGEEGEGLPDLELDKPSTEPGGEIVANGRNCEPVSNVAISVADKPAGSTDADTEGRYRARLKLPDGVGVGRHSVVAACAGKTFETTVDVVVLAQTASPAAAAGAAAVAIATLGVFAFYILQAGDLFKGEGSGPRRR